MPTPLRVAVIGLGEVATRRHLPALVNHPHFQITAAAEVDAARAARVALQFSIPRISADARAVLESADVDVVAILTPPFTHAELAHLALDAGKHVLVEKPMTLDVAGAQDLVAHAERASTKFLVAFNQRHHRHLQHAREILRSGKLGTLRTAASFLGNTHARRTQSAWHSDALRGGDLFFELGVHHFDALRFLLNAEVTQINAQELHSAQQMATLAAQMRFTNDLLVSTTLAEDTVEHNGFEIIGDRGRLTLSLYRFDGVRVIPRGAYDGSIRLRVADARRTFVSLPTALPRIRRGGDYDLTYRAEWDHFFEVIQNNIPPLATVRDGAAATRIASAARRAVTQNAPVLLDHPTATAGT